MPEIDPETKTPGSPVPHAANARGRGLAQRAAIVCWTHRWVATDAMVIGRVLGISMKAAAHKLVRMHKAGLLQPVDHPGAGIRLWMLSRRGADLAMDYAGGSAPLPWLDAEELHTWHEPSRRGSVRLLHDLVVQHAVIMRARALQSSGATIRSIHSDRDIRAENSGYDQILVGDLIPDGLIKYTEKNGDDLSEIIEVQLSWDKPDQRNRRLFWLDRTLTDESNNIRRADIWLAGYAMRNSYRNEMARASAWKGEAVQQVDRFGRTSVKLLWARQTERFGGKTQPLRHHIKGDIELHVMPDDLRARYLGHRA